MSMGPKTKEAEVFTETNATKVVNTTKKAVNKYFEDPVFYLFYGSLFALMVGLFFHIDFSWKLYGLIFILGISKPIKKFIEEENIWNRMN